MLIEQLESRRLLASSVAGVMDSTFGLGGVVITDFKTNRPTESVRQVIPMSDGRVLAIGNVVPHGDDGYSFRWAALARYNADGSFDPTFGDGGATNQKLSGLKNFGAEGGMILSDGKILVVGAAVLANQDPDLPDDSAMTLIRYTADGVLDTTFGTNGYVFFDDMNVFSGSTWVIALAGDKMLFTASAPKPTVICVNGDGSLDSSFGTGGIADVGPTASTAAFFLSRRGDGKLLLYSIMPDPSLPDGTTATRTITRLTAGGHLDITFGDGDGVASTGLLQSADLQAQTMDAAPDGGAYLYVFRRPEGVWKAQLCKLTPAGQLDTSFGQGGFASVTYDGANFFRPEAIKVQADGRILVAGQTEPGIGEDYDVNDLLVARFNSDGSPDTTFGNNGARRVQSDSEQQSFFQSMALTNDGNIFLGGHADSHFLVAKMLNNAPPETSVFLDEDGLLTITGSTVDDTILISSNNIMGWNVTVNGVVHTFDESTIQMISVAGGTGRDYIDARNLTALPPISGVDFLVTLDGGDGNDIIVGSQGRDRITGGNDDDKLHGWSGNDWVSGNAQKDRVIGGDGNDTVSGNGARDFVVGEAGNDTLLGGDQPDTLLGMAGDDSLMGEGGHDRLDGGDGVDFMSGGGGNDVFYASDTDIDHIIGGIAAFDRAQADDDDVLEGIEQLLA